MKKLNKLVASSLLGLSLFASSAIAGGYYASEDPGLRVGDYKKSVDLSLGQVSYDLKGLENSFTGGLNVKAERLMYSHYNFGNIYLGAGIGIELFELKSSVDGASGSETGIMADFYPTVSYDIPDYNMSFNALLGYSIGDVNNVSFSGLTWGIGAEYKLSDNWSIGASHKITDAGFDTDIGNLDLEIARTSVYFSRKF